MNEIWLCKWGYEATSLALILSWSHEIPWAKKALTNQFKDVLFLQCGAP